MCCIVGPCGNIGLAARIYALADWVIVLCCIDCIGVFAETDNNRCSFGNKSFQHGLRKGSLGYNRTNPRYIGNAGNLFRDDK